MFDDNLKSESVDCCNSIYKKVFELRENIVNDIDDDNIDGYIKRYIKRRD